MSTARIVVLVIGVGARFGARGGANAGAAESTPPEQLTRRGGNLEFIRHRGAGQITSQK